MRGLTKRDNGDEGGILKGLMKEVEEDSTEDNT